MVLDLRDELLVDEAPRRRPLRARAWDASWPKLAALAIVLGVWQSLVWIHWRPPFTLSPPSTVLGELRHLASTAHFWDGVARTLRRAVTGYALAIVIGGTVGLLVARIRALRVAIGSLITGLQTMPSIAWFPLAILLFQLNERAIVFVVVLGAAPSVANGIVAGVDHVPPILLRAGKVVGARGINLYRHVVLPAALPSVIAGLKQGWAFAWRSLMAGELLVIVPGQSSLGVQLVNARDTNDAARLIALMIAILVIGILVDTAFVRAETAVRQRRGLIEAH